MKSILKLSLILTFLVGCNGGTPSVFSPSYNSVSDFEGEYIAYDEDGKILYGGKPFAKVEKFNNDYHFVALADTLKDFNEHFNVQSTLSMIEKEVIERSSKKIPEYELNISGVKGNYVRIYKIKKGEKFYYNKKTAPTNFMLDLNYVDYSKNFFIEKIK